MIQGLLFEPSDTWCFGDGTPFAGGGTVVQGGWGGLFPPYPLTLVGAARVAVARAMGWDGTGRWNADLHPIVGDGPSDTGQLRFKGVFVTRDGLPVIPVPRDLFGTLDAADSWQPQHRVGPGVSLDCDLGHVRLPDLPESPEETQGTGWWVDLEHLLTADPDGVKLRVMPESDLWAVEPRVGIRRDPRSHTVEEGALFTVRHIRPRPGVGLAVWVEGLPEFEAAGLIVPLGGEGRAARVSPWRWDPPERVPRQGQAKLTLVTPAKLSVDQLRGSEPAWDGRRIVSACTAGTVRVGGWDSANRGPLPLESCLAAGSVLFLDGPVQVQGLPFAHLGGATEAGFGLAVVDTWSEQGGAG